MNTLKNSVKNFGFSFSGQFTKNMRISIGAGYLPILMVSMGLLFWGICYITPFRLVLNHGIIAYSLRLDIILPMGDVIGYLSLSIFSLLLILPLIVLSSDFESRNFEILRTTRFNSLGYYLANIAYTLLICFIVTLEFTYISEGVIFYSGYEITSGFIIDPIIVALPYMLFLIVPSAIAIFIATASGNRTISIVVFIFSGLMLSIIVMSNIARLYNGSWVNDFLFLSSPFPTFNYMIPNLLHIVPSGNGSTISDYFGGYYGILNYHVLWQSALLFLAMGFLVLLTRRYSAKIARYIQSGFSHIIKREGERDE